MISKILGQFVKDIVDLQKLTNIDDGQRNVTTMSCILVFVFNILQQTSDYLDKLQLNEEVKISLYDKLYNINNEISKLMAYLKPENHFHKTSGESQESEESTDKRPSVEIVCAAIPPASTSRLLQTELRNYLLRSVEVTSYNALSEIRVPNVEQDNCDVRLMELHDSVIVDGDLALNRMLWNSMERRDGASYWCELCSRPVMWQSGCESHISSSAHASKVAASKVCIPSLGIYSTILINDNTDCAMQCCVCTIKYTIADGVDHNESANHKQALSAAKMKCSSLLERIEAASNNKETDNQMLIENVSEILQEHNIILFENEFKCHRCNVQMQLDVCSLFRHVTDHKHAQLYQTELKQRYSSLPGVSLAIDTIYRGFIQMYNSKNVSYCSICSVLLRCVSVSEVEKHIGSVAHNLFLVLYLRHKDKLPSITLYDHDDSEASHEPVQYCADTDEYNTRDEDEPRWRYEDESKVVVDGEIVVDKSSWHIMTLNEGEYFCSPCNMSVDTETFSRHIDTDVHRENLKDWPLCVEFRQHLLREYKKAGISYCIGCKTFLSKYNLKDHAESTVHKTRFEELTGECGSLISSFNERYTKATYPNFREGTFKVFLILLKQNQLRFVAGNNRIFCHLCKEEFDSYEPKNLYEHIARTGHFKRFVARRAINSLYENPNFYRGFIMDKDRPDKVYCLVCNLVIPLHEISGHWMGKLHRTILPSFIETVFSHHNIVYADGYVQCNLCNKTLCDKEIDVRMICRHVKESVHLSEFETDLRNKFRDVTGCRDDLKLTLNGRKVERFQHLNVAYCQLCNIVFNVDPSSESDLTSADLCEHRFSKIHYIFKHNVEKENDLIRLVPL